MGLKSAMLTCGAISLEHTKIAFALYEKVRILSVRQRTEPSFEVAKIIFCAKRLVNLTPKAV